MSSILQMHLSFSKTLSSSSSTTPLFLHTKLSGLSIQTPARKTSTIIRMGGGPRTYPGGVSKWQWKRMQSKKATQLLKARLCRERQIYEMRKRAELKAAVSELEKPWEVVEKAPTLFSVRADEQVKVLADRFQRPGGFDLWTDKDGPQLFEDVEGLPSARFFPKGVVHSLKPYGKVEDSIELDNEVSLAKNDKILAGSLGSKDSTEMTGGIRNRMVEKKNSGGRNWRKGNWRRGESREGSSSTIGNDDRK